MNINAVTKKRIDDRVRLVEKHEREIEEQQQILINLNDQLEDIDDEIKEEFNNVYKSKHYKSIWGTLEVNKKMAKDTIFRKVYEKQVQLINNKINIANTLLEEAIKKKNKRVKEIKELLPKKTKSATFRQTTNRSKNNLSKTVKRNSNNKNGRKK